jgi:hypothetical protein
MIPLDSTTSPGSKPSSAGALMTTTERLLLVPFLAVMVAGGTSRLQSPSPPTPSVTVTTAAGDHVVVQIQADDRAPRDVAAVGALDLKVDDRESQQVLLTPGTGRTTYEALVGPLTAGPHRITVDRSALWSWPGGLAIGGVTGRIVAAGADESVVLRYAPTLGIRADTVGTASDLPLVMYAEDDRREGRGWIRYSVIISNEDGGTSPPALMARWGRTTDIELIYEVEVDGVRIVSDRFQGPDHEVRPFAGPREGQHPQLLVATLNNMFIDRGKSIANVRPVPRVVDLNRRTRESVMDDSPWIYPLMARELIAEKRIGTQIEDPREFLYVEAGLALENAAASVRVGSDAGGWQDSTRGRADLAVNRNGWVRIAVHAPASSPTLKWECRAAPATAAGSQPRCQIEWGRAFRLGKDYLPGENVVSPGKVQMGAGLSEPIPLADRGPAR